MHALWSLQSRLDGISHADISHEGGWAAFDAIGRNAENTIDHDYDRTKLLVVDLAVQFISVLSQCKDLAHESDSPGLSLKVAKTDELLGWDLPDIIHGRRNARRRVMTLRTREKWVQLFHNDSNIAVIFCTVWSLRSDPRTNPGFVETAVRSRKGQTSSL